MIVKMLPRFLTTRLQQPQKISDFLRSTQKTPDLLRDESSVAQHYQRRNFDLLSLQASLLSGHSGQHSPSQLSIGLC